MDRDTLIVKKCMLFFFGFAFLILCTVGSFNSLNVRYRGVPATGRIVSFEKYRPYHSKNRLTPLRYAVKIQYPDASGKFQTLDAVLSGDEQQHYRAEIGTEIPFWVVSSTGQYEIGEKRPGLTLVIAANLILIPSAILLLVFAFKTKIPRESFPF